MSTTEQTTSDVDSTGEVPDFHVGVAECEHGQQVVLQHGDTRWFFEAVQAVNLGSQLIGAVAAATGTDVREIVDAVLRSDAAEPPLPQGA